MTPADALRHPTWDMGAKITIDSATLANKALEVIEAHFLFGVAYDRIEAVVHPQSIIHSMVEMVDGSVLAQMGFPTMELPILYALTHPERLPYELPPLRPGGGGDADLRGRAHGRAFPRSRWGWRRGAPAARRPRCSTPPTRWRSPSSWPAACRSPVSPRRSRTRWRAGPAAPVHALDDVLQADAWARRAAHESLTRLAPC